MGFSGCHILLSPLKLKKSLLPSPSIYGSKIPIHIPELTSRKLLTAVQSYPGLSHGTPDSSWSPGSSVAAVKGLLRHWLSPKPSFGMLSCPHGQSGESQGALRVRNSGQCHRRVCPFPGDKDYPSCSSAAISQSRAGVDGGAGGASPKAWEGNAQAAPNPFA